MSILDLHTHTKYSDGTTSPEDVVRACAEESVKIMSVTDHDTIGAFEEAYSFAKKVNILFVPGVEISTREHDHLHILGYNVDPINAALTDFLARNREIRNIRIKKMISRLQQHGLDIKEEDVFSLAGAVVSRAHVADAIKNKGIAPNRQMAFRNYLIAGKPGYEPSDGPTVVETINIIKQSGGMAFIAHPGIVKEFWDFPKWVNAGLDGVEVYYPSHSAEVKQALLAITKKYDLYISGGSDHHGNKSGRDNRPGMEVPQDVFDAIKLVLKPK